MNKKIVLGIIIGIVLLIVCFFIKPNGGGSLLEDPAEIYENAQRESAAIKENEKKDLQEITVATYLEKYTQDQASIILVKRTGCPYCEVAEPILQKISKDYDLKIDSLNTNNFTEDEIADFLHSNEIFNEGFGTPFLMIVQNNSIVDFIDGVTDYEHYVDLFSKNLLIKK